MDDSAVCLPWDKNFHMTLLKQIVYEMYRKFTREYRDISVCHYLLGQTLKTIHTGNLVKWNNTMEPFVLPQQLLWLTVG